MDEVLDKPRLRRLRETQADGYWREHVASAAEGLAVLVALAAFCLSFL